MANKSPARELGQAPNLAPSLMATRESEMNKLSSPLRSSPLGARFLAQRSLRKLQSAQNLGATARTLADRPAWGPMASAPGVQDQQDGGTSPTKNRNGFGGGRNRCNSAASLPMTPPMHMSTTVVFKTSASADNMSLERLIRDGPPDGDVTGALESMRLKILDQGIRSDSDGMSSIRIYVWLILLNAPVLSTDTYLALIHRGASPAYSKIRNDTFRTLTTNPLFHRRVSEASLIRLLNATAWMLHDAKQETRASYSRLSLPDAQPRSSRTGNSPASSASAKSRTRALTLASGDTEASLAERGIYVQGMNVLAAPFLYAARSEAEAFVAFHRLLTKECPGYIRGAMDGVHRGVALIDKVLAKVDPKLHGYLMSKGLSAEIYAFPSVLTLCACTPNLPEVLRLWDFLFAYGPHLNIPCIVAQLIMMRSDLLAEHNPNKLLRSFPNLRADRIKQTALLIIKLIPDDIYAEIVVHAH